MSFTDVESENIIPEDNVEVMKSLTEADSAVMSDVAEETEVVMRSFTVPDSNCDLVITITVDKASLTEVDSTVGSDVDEKTKVVMRSFTEADSVVMSDVAEETEWVMMSLTEDDSAVVSDVAEITEVFMISSIDAEFCIVFELVKYIRSLIEDESGLTENGLVALNMLILLKSRPLSGSFIVLPVFFNNESASSTVIFGYFSFKMAQAPAT